MPDTRRPDGTLYTKDTATTETITQLIWRILSGKVKDAHLEAENIHGALIAIICMTFVSTLVMWLLNISGLKEVNFLFFFVGGMYLVTKLSHPKIVVSAAVAGAGVQGLRDEDITQGAAKGTVVLYQIFLGILLGFWILAGILSTWSFALSPASFFPIAAMGMVIAITIEFFDMKGNVFPIVIIGYALVIIAIATWKTFPDEVTGYFVSEDTEVLVPAVAQPTVTHESATWETTEDGTLPVNVWSKTFNIGNGCRTLYDGGNGTDFIVRYRLDSSEWKIHPGGNNYPPANEVQFMLKKPRTAVPVKVTCF